MLPLNLHRTDFAQVGPTNKNCMRVIPAKPKEKEKRQLKRAKKGNTDSVVVGSQNGVLMCLLRNGTETEIEYKTNPTSAINAVTLGGAVGTLQDKVFVCSDGYIQGISRKGKPFFSFQSHMAETPNRMFIYGVDLILTGAKSVNHYHDCTDTNFFLCADPINDVVALVGKAGAWAERPFTTVIACDDSTVKVLEGSDMAYDIQLKSPPTVLYLFLGDGDSGYSAQKVLYGTRDGRLGLLDLPEKKGELLWEINTTTPREITCITCHKFLGNERPDVIVGKADGLVEVYAVNEDDQLQLAAIHNCDETIHSVSCGKVCTEASEDIIVCTKTGWVFALTLKPLAGSFSQSGSNVNIKVQQLKNEIDELKNKVAEERARYDEMTKKDGKNLGFVPHFQIHDRFEFSAAHGAYNLTIELILPIDYVIVQSYMPITLMEVERNASVACILKQDEYVSSEEEGSFDYKNIWPVLASYRCQAKNNRIELRVKIDEGISGKINVYIAPNTSPKGIQLRAYDVKPLSAHVRIPQIDETRPMTTLALNGNFSLAEVHSWLVMIVPGVQPKCPPVDNVNVCFQSAVNGGTQLQATYSKGSATFKSDSITTIAIIRDIISKETTKNQIRIQQSCDLNEESIEHCIRLLHPRMNELLTLEKNRLLTMALKELEANTTDISFLSDENKQILRDHDKIFAQSEMESVEDSNISTIYQGLLLDRSKLTGISVKGKADELQELLRNNYSLDGVIQFFKQTAESFKRH